MKKYAIFSCRITLSDNWVFNEIIVIQLWKNKMAVIVIKNIYIITMYPDMPTHTILWKDNKIC